jgi:DHA2 family multidrug resistance protein
MSAALEHDAAQLSGKMLWIAALLLALGNFLAVLNMTIANVAVPTIAGNLGISSSQGTWVITSYSVAEAICVPLTGWLAARFGSVPLFVGAVGLFGLFSGVCGLSGSFDMLVLARVAQGLAGGPVMPMSQTLLLRIFPKEQAAAATGLWAVTTLVAPVVGPILGGILCDDYSWNWVFLVNVPLSILCTLGAWLLLKRYKDQTVRDPIDKVGLGLLAVWVGSLQVLLDQGKDLDWFSSAEIRVLAILAIVGFVAFLIWESTERRPVVDLRVFKSRGFAIGNLTLVLAFGGFFALNVLTPLWLQGFMGYTATWAGYAMAWSGVTSILVTPLVANLIKKGTDPRILVFSGVACIAATTFYRSFATTDMTFWHIGLPLLAQGLGLAVFYLPLTIFILGSVDEHEIASAAGLMNFLRTLAGAIGTSLINTAWEDGIKFDRTDLVAASDPGGAAVSALSGGMGSIDSARAVFEFLIESQASMLATNALMVSVAIIIAVGALSVWLAPRPAHQIDTSHVH